MEKITLEAEPRGTGRHPVRELRNAQRVPAVVYGAHQTPEAISVDARALHGVLATVGTGLLSLQIGARPPQQVLVREVQRHPVKHHVLHVDFQAVSMTEKLRLDVPILAEGASPLVTANPDIVLVRNMDTVEIECLPQDIPSHLTADLSSLRSIHDEILVKDLATPPGVRIVTEPDHVVFSLTLSRAGAEEEAAAEAPAADQVEVVAKGKAKEGAEEEEKETRETKK